MNKYSKYKDKELFKLWKDITTDIEYNAENGIWDNSEYDLSQVGEELVERGYKLTDEEFDAIDYYLQKSKIYDSGFYVCQEEWGEDYFYDDDNEEKLTLKDGLQIVYESMVLEYVEEYPIEIKNGLKKAIKRFLDIDLEV